MFLYEKSPECIREIFLLGLLVSPQSMGAAKRSVHQTMIPRLAGIVHVMASFFPRARKRVNIKTVDNFVVVILFCAVLILKMPERQSVRHFKISTAQKSIFWNEDFLEEKSWSHFISMITFVAFIFSEIRICSACNCERIKQKDASFTASFY